MNGPAKVGQLNHPVRSDDVVARRHVAMQVVLVVQKGQSSCGIRAHNHLVNKLNVRHLKKKKEQEEEKKEQEEEEEIKKKKKKKKEGDKMMKKRR